jgi:hypothetical protein
MRRIIPLTLVGGLLLFGGASAASAAPARFRTLFCPECWEYLWSPDAVDLTGHCGSCGKHPVEIEAERMSWWWCEGKRSWRHSACNENPERRCCTQEEASLAVIAPGPWVQGGWYCPADRAFSVTRLPILMWVVCRNCARPAVHVDAMERTWYWCETDGAWAPEPCPLSPVKNCCSERKGLLLVHPDLGPIATWEVGETDETIR